MELLPRSKFKPDKYFDSFSITYKSSGRDKDYEASKAHHKLILW